VGASDVMDASGHDKAGKTVDGERWVSAGCCRTHLVSASF